MKRLWLFLLSLALVIVFSASAFAVDVKFSGEYFAAGMYLDKVGLNKSKYTYYPIKDFTPIPTTIDSGETSTAFYFQRLRVQTDFIVSQGLKLVTQFDAMERAWGASRSTTDLPDSRSIATRAENENIAFDIAYIYYESPIGLFQVGYMPDWGWGTVFNDSEKNNPTLGVIQYILPIEPVILSATYYKLVDGNHTAVNSLSTATDSDLDKYMLGVTYGYKTNFEAGILYEYMRVAADKPVPVFGYVLKGMGFAPYFKAKYGPVYMEGELIYAWGKLEWENPSDMTGPDQDLQILLGYLNVGANLGMFYVGGTFAYVSGDDPGTKDKREDGFGVLDGGRDFNPCLIMFNEELSYWAGPLYGYPGDDPNNTSVNGSPMKNVWFLQGKAGLRPTDKLDIMASVSYAKADKKLTAQWLHKDYGWEVDLTATYKLTNNLSYMLGAGYFFTGDYYKGWSDADTDLSDDLLVINKLTLTF